MRVIGGRIVPDGDSTTPKARPTRILTEVAELRRQVARAELIAAAALAIAMGLLSGLLVFIAQQAAR